MIICEGVRFSNLGTKGSIDHTFFTLKRKKKKDIRLSFVVTMTC